MKQKAQIQFATALLMFFNSMSQDSISVSIENNTFKVSPTPLKADFSKDIFIVQKGSGCNGFIVANPDSGSYTLTKVNNSIYKISAVSASLSTIRINANCNEIALSTFRINKVAASQPVTQPATGAQTGAQSGSSTPPGPGTETGGTFTASDADASTFFQNMNFPLFSTDTRYDKKNNMAFIYFGPSGNSLGPLPVNIDADDYLHIYVAVPKTERDNYSINVEGSYNAYDLNFRPSENIDKANQQSKGDPDDTWTYITAKFGPFTSAFASIQIKRNETAFVQKKVKINTLYNVAVGASFVSTNLAMPEFELVPLSSSTNTITKVNNGRRTLATFNVIFYWQPTLDWIVGNLKGRQNITKGRDILKEANFWERLNPTFGVALNNDWSDNYFAGGTFEFARGGNLVFGGHYGKVQKLVDINFIPGETVFTGSKADIKLTNEWKWGFFFGITLDNRIFNRLLSRE